MWGFNYNQYLEVFVNFNLGFMAHTLTINATSLSNCTNHASMVIFNYQQMDEHINHDRWLMMVEEQYNIMVLVDPIAKACVPTFYEVYVDSDEYGPTLIEKQRVFYNVFYRLGNIVIQGYKINDQFHLWLQHNATDSDMERDFTEYVSLSRKTGEMLGDLFK